MALSALTYVLPWRWPKLLLQRLRKPSGETDYETILSALAQEASQVQSRLTQIRTRERRAMITIPFYILLLWAAYSWVCWYADWLPPISTVVPGLLAAIRACWAASLPSDDDEDKQDNESQHRLPLAGSQTASLLYLPIVSTPLLLLFGRRLVRWWYERIASAEEAHLRKLRKTQRSKIDEIKKATRYDHLRMLLDKYDDTQSAYVTPRRKGVTAAAGQRGGTSYQQQQQMLQKGLGVNAAAAAAASKQQQRRSMPEPPVNLLPTRLDGGNNKDGNEINGADAGIGSGPGLEQQHSSSDATAAPKDSADGGAAAADGGKGGSVKTAFPVSASMPHLAQQSPVESHQALLQLQTQSSQAHSPPSQQPSPLQRQLMQSHAYQSHAAAVAEKQQQRTLLDKMADLVLGPDPSTRGPGPEQRYALICPDCHRHNGLCMKEDFEEIQYICPNCGRFNSNRPSTVPTSWPGRNRVDSNSSVRSFLFSAFGGGGGGETNPKDTHRSSGSHLPSISASGTSTGLQLPASDSSDSLPTTPSGRFATLQTDEGPKSADSQSAGESGADAMLQQQKRKQGSGGLNRSTSNASSSYFMRSNHSLANMPEEESQEILLTPDQRDGDDEDADAPPGRRGGLFGTKLRRRAARESASSDAAAASGGANNANNAESQQQNSDDMPLPPVASLLDDGEEEDEEEEAEDSMERHRTTLGAARKKFN